MATDSRGRPCAEAATIAGVHRPSQSSRSRQSRRSANSATYGAVAVFFLVVTGAAMAGAIPGLVLGVYLLMSAVTFAAYAFDKSAAQSGRWRTNESTLHLLSLVGGWPGALVAQGALRHKSSKQPFRIVFFATVVLMGLLQVFAGMMQWGKFIRLVPHPVMMGFVNGLAILILLAQFDSFRGPDGGWLPNNELIIMAVLAAATMAIIQFAPKLTQAVPSILIAGIVALIVAMQLDPFLTALRYLRKRR